MPYPGKISRADQTNFRYLNRALCKRVNKIDRLSAVPGLFTAVFLSAFPSFARDPARAIPSLPENKERNQVLLLAGELISAFLYLIQLKPAKVVANYTTDCHLQSGGKVLPSHTPL